MPNDEDSGHEGAVTTFTVSQADDLPRLRILPSAGWVSLKLYELWEYRELLYFLVWRDIGGGAGTGGGRVRAYEAILAVVAFSQQETNTSLYEGIAEALGKGFSH